MPDLAIFDYQLSCATTFIAESKICTLQIWEIYGPNFTNEQKFLKLKIFLLSKIGGALILNKNRMGELQERSLFV